MEYKVIAPRQDNTTLLEQILLNRGFQTKEEINHYLTADENDLINPLKLDHMNDGLKMLAKHINSNNETVIIVDSDCDGYTSSAILLNYLNNFFPAWIQNHISYYIHGGKQHGLVDFIDEYNWLAKGIRLVICPDSASNDYEFHARLKKMWS